MTALVVRGFVDDGVFTLDGIREVLAAPRTWRIVGQTLGQAVAGTVVAVLLGVPGAHLLYRRRFPGRRLLRAVVSVPFVLPTVVVGVAFQSLLATHGPLGFLGLQESFAAIVAALVFFNYSVVVRTVGALWSRLDPRAEDAARTLGAGRVRVLATVTLPALAPGDRVRSRAGVPVLRVGLRGGAGARRGQLRHHRDRDLVPDHPAARPAGRSSAVDPATRRGQRDPDGRRGHPRPPGACAAPFRQPLRRPAAVRADAPSAVLTAVVVLGPAGHPDGQPRLALVPDRGRRRARQLPRAVRGRAAS